MRGGADGEVLALEPLGEGGNQKKKPKVFIEGGPGGDEGGLTVAQKSPP